MSETDICLGLLVIIITLNLCNKRQPLITVTPTTAGLQAHACELLLHLPNPSFSTGCMFSLLLSWVKCNCEHVELNGYNIPKTIINQK